MATRQPERHAPQPPKSVMQWLLDSDPSIRWQVMRDLSAAPAELIAAERSRVASEGWGIRLLGLQGPDGNWGDNIATPHWRSNLYTLLRLRDLGLDPTSARARRAVDLVRDRVTWGPEFGNSPFFEGEVEPCINGGVLALGSYFGHTSARLVDRLLGEQFTDGGLELRGGAWLRALLVPHDDLRSRRTPGVRERQRRHGRRDGRSNSGSGIPAGASHAPEVVIR